jgi:hypothetical protein
MGPQPISQHPTTPQWAKWAAASKVEPARQSLHIGASCLVTLPTRERDGHTERQANVGQGPHLVTACSRVEDERCNVLLRYAPRILSGFLVLAAVQISGKTLFS